MGRLEDHGDAPGRTGWHAFSMARQAHCRLIVARDYSGRNAAGAAIYLLFIRLVFRED